MKPKMKRVLIGLPEQQVEKLDHLVQLGIYPDRNEANRTGIRYILQRYGEALA